MLMIPEMIWNKTSYLFEKRSKVGRPPHDARLTISGILYIMQTGAQWRNLPEVYGKHKTIHTKFMLWAKKGFIAQLFNKLIEIAIKYLGAPEALQSDTSY